MFLLILLPPTNAGFISPYNEGFYVLMSWFNPEEIFRLIEKYQVYQFIGVPTMYQVLLNHPVSGNTPQRGANEGNAADDALMVDQGPPNPLQSPASRCHNRGKAARGHRMCAREGGWLP